MEGCNLTTVRKLSDGGSISVDEILERERELLSDDEARCCGDEAKRAIKSCGIIIGGTTGDGGAERSGAGGTRCLAQA